MDSFGWIWQLLAPQGEFCRRMGACRRLWDSFDLEKQRAIYRTIRDKLAAGEFVSENPYYAIYDNAYPPRKRQRVMSYADYYAKYGTTKLQRAIMTDYYARFSATSSDQHRCNIGPTSVQSRGLKGK